MLEYGHSFMYTKVSTKSGVIVCKELSFGLLADHQANGTEISAATWQRAET